MKLKSISKMKQSIENLNYKDATQLHITAGKPVIRNRKNRIGCERRN